MLAVMVCDIAVSGVLSHQRLRVQKIQDAYFKAASEQLVNVVISGCSSSKKSSLVQ